MTPKIALLMPTYSNIPPKVYATHMNAALTAARHGYWITHIGITEQELIGHARGRLVDELNTTQCTHALWLDADVTVPLWAIVCMAELDKPLVSGIYFQKVEPPHLPVIYTKHGFSTWKKKERGKHHHILQWEEGSYFPIDACGFGCVLIKREVFEKVKAPYFQFTEESSEDIDFCIKVRKAGFEMFADSRVLCGHIGPKGEITYEDYKKHRPNLNLNMVKYDPITNKHEVIRNEFVELTTPTA